MGQKYIKSNASKKKVHEYSTTSCCLAIKKFHGLRSRRKREYNKSNADAGKEIGA